MKIFVLALAILISSAIFYPSDIAALYYGKGSVSTTYGSGKIEIIATTYTSTLGDKITMYQKNRVVVTISGYSQFEITVWKLDKTGLQFEYVGATPSLAIRNRLSSILYEYRMLDIKPVQYGEGLVWFSISEGQLYSKLRTQHPNGYFRLFPYQGLTEPYITVDSLTYDQAGVRLLSGKEVYTSHQDNAMKMVLYNDANAYISVPLFGPGYFFNYNAISRWVDRYIGFSLVLFGFPQ